MIYSSYSKRIKDIVAEKNFKKSWNGFDGSRISGINQVNNLIKEQRLFSNQTHLSLDQLSSVLQITPVQDAKLGLHPDLKHLKQTDNAEYQYIVSVFIDIQGSTNLHKKYDLEDIYRITNTIQSAAIHTCLALGGHIQRLQGDGVFAYFGGRNLDKKLAVERAVVACSMFSYFVENDLKNIFLEDGIEDINTRIGIDFGDTDDVLWANFGLLDVSELTTVSLHTSLASKMQAWAPKNGIVVGQHIKDRLQSDESHFDLVKNSKGEVEKRYIFEIPEKRFRYTQYDFKWKPFLVSLPFISSDKEGNLYLVDPAKKQEELRIARLRNTATLLSSGNAYSNGQGKISNQPTGTHHQPHRFHYGK